MRKISIYTLFLTLTLSGLAQLPYTGPEKKWAFFHPLAAIKVKHIASKCQPLYLTCLSRLRPDTFLTGGAPDALRHGFFMAAFAQSIRPSALIKLGKAHEKGNYLQWRSTKTEDGNFADSLLCVMDLYNNKKGCSLGEANKKASMKELLEICMRELQTGGFVILKRDKRACRVYCDNQPVDMIVYYGTWNIPGCLVASDYRYMD